jgi:hypothetical protein
MYIPFNSLKHRDKVTRAQLLAYKGAHNGGDPYFAEALQAFVASNPREQAVKTSFAISWSDEKPLDVTPIPVEQNPAHKQAVADHQDETKVGEYYADVGLDLKPSPKKGLSDLAKGDMLVILGHGSFHAAFIGYKRYIDASHVETYKIDMATLAVMLMHEGLPKDHVFIKINACWAGGAEGVEGSMAERLTTGLKALGYRHIIAGGSQYATTHGNGRLFLRTPMQSKSDNPELTMGYIPDAALEHPYAPEWNNTSSIEEMIKYDPWRWWYDHKSCLRKGRDFQGTPTKDAVPVTTSPRSDDEEVSFLGNAANLIESNSE